MAEELLTVETPKPFDFAAYKAEKHAAPGEPAKPAEVKAEEPKSAKAEAAPATEDGADPEGHTPTLPRSVRRELNKLRAELGEAKGQVAILRELQAAGYTKAEAKVEAATITGAVAGEPTRDQFATDAEYYKAVARHEIKAEFAKEQQTKALDTEQAQFMTIVGKATEKFSKDVENFPDWADVVEEMDDIQIDTGKQHTFIGLIAQSDQRAAILYHLSKNPAEREALFAMSPSAQIAHFHRLEGRMEIKYMKSAEAEKPAKPTAAELDAKKAKPSASVGVKGGTAATVGLSMFMADGRTMNPAWKAAQNEKAGVRA